MDALKKRLPIEIDDARITPEVTAVTEERIVVILRGDVNTEQERENVVRLVEGSVPANFKGKVEVRPRLFVKSPGGATLPEPEVTDLWVLTYIRSRVSSTGGTAPTTPATKDNVDLLVDALNQIYSPPGKPTVQRGGVGRLLLRGPRTTVLDIKRFLALIDAPWPQVQMNLWAIQVSGSPQDVSVRIQEIGRQVREVRDQMQEVQRELAWIVVNDLESEQKHWDFVRKQFKLTGVDLDVGGPLSLNESLILLTLHPRRLQKVEALQEFVRDQWPIWTKQWTEVAPPPGRRSSRKRGSPAPTLPEERFQRLHALFARSDQGSYKADMQGFTRFGESLYCFKNRDRWKERPDAPSSLVRTGAVVDRVLKSVMDAFAADMASLFLDPLLHRIQSSASGKNDDGIALVGRSRVVVTSGLEAGLAPEMASYVESGRPKPFGEDLLNRAFPASQAGEGTTQDVLTGAGKVLAGLSDGQALSLAALLMAETEPAYTKVAPGIAVNIRPSVLPDGGAARLTIDARFGVASTPLDQERTDIWRQAPPAGISSHNVRTDASVSAFDLFDISSFSVTASHPQAPYYVPILGRLPVLGQAFQFPRRNKETEFESLVLVNTVILPRSLELHRFYGREVDLPVDKKLEDNCRTFEIGAGMAPDPAQSENP